MLKLVVSEYHLVGELYLTAGLDNQIIKRLDRGQQAIHSKIWVGLFLRKTWLATRRQLYWPNIDRRVKKGGFYYDSKLNQCDRNVYSTEMDTRWRGGTIRIRVDVNFSRFLKEWIREEGGLVQGHPTANFGKISVQKTIWELEFSEHLL